MGRAVTERGGKSWFFLPVDYAWGEAISADLGAAIKDSGGRSWVRENPLNTSDFLVSLQEQGSKADLSRLAECRARDTINPLSRRMSSASLSRSASRPVCSISMMHMPLA